KENCLDFCAKKNIVSIFSCLHPLIVSDLFFTDFGSVIDLNKTIVIDLKISLEDQRKDYRKSNKSEINQLKKNKGYSVKIISKNDETSLKKFVDIYHETMTRVNANSYYYFSIDYF